MTRVKSAERTQFLHDIMITGLEGGVGYWSVADEIVRHEDDDLWYRSYTLYCSEGGKQALECGNGKDDPCKGHKVTPDLIARGLGLATSKRPENPDKDPTGWHYENRKHVILANRENDGGEIDAEDADSIIQLGIFGQVVFG